MVMGRYFVTVWNWVYGGISCISDWYIIYNRKFGRWFWSRFDSSTDYDNNSGIHHCKKSETIWVAIETECKLVEIEVPLSMGAGMKRKEEWYDKLGTCRNFAYYTRFGDSLYCKRKKEGSKMYWLPGSRELSVSNCKESQWM